MKYIIIVDDDPGVQDAFQYVFDPARYEVAIYADGSEIFNNRYRLPDLFILDKQLRGVDGLDLCRHLKSQAATKHIPVIMTSASPDIARLARLAEADCSLEKPFSLKELRDLAEGCMSH